MATAALNNSSALIDNYTSEPSQLKALKSVRPQPTGRAQYDEEIKKSRLIDEYDEPSKVE
jgi:hypothetical protein